MRSCAVPATRKGEGRQGRRSVIDGLAAVAGDGWAQGIQACQTVGFASIHCFAASSADSFLFVMASATEFWSALPHLKFLMNVAASPPLAIHSVRTILLRTYGG